MGVRLSKARLAVVFSRADLIDAPDDDVAAWASDELGLGNLVRSARLNFKEACFFRTAAVMADGVMHESVPALLRWVLARDDFAVPDDTVPDDTVPDDTEPGNTGPKGTGPGNTVPGNTGPKLAGQP